MKTKLLILLLASGLMLNISGCSSSDDDTKDSQVADAQDPGLDAEGAQAAKDMDKPADSADASADANKDDFAKDEEVVADSGDDAKDSGALPDKSLDTKADDKTSDDKTSDDLLADDSTTTETPAPDAKSDVADTDAPKEDAVFDSTAPADSAAPVDSTASANSDTPADIDTASQSPEQAAAAGALADNNTTPAEAPKSVASLKKIKEAPFKHGGQLLNTVYVARSGDTIASISQKIYGEDKAKDLKKANSFLKNRDAKVGDKIYYNSPKRPTDSEKMLTYYEDNGIPAQTYVAKAGDNIHAVSKDLLGDKNSWKEVWATNLAVESKGDLPEGTELRYWPTDAATAAAPAPAPAPEVAAATPPPAAPAATAQENNKPKDDFALPDDMAKNNQPNPAAPAAATVAEVPPPPPPPPAAPIQKTVASKDMGMNKDLTFMLSAGGLLLVGIGVLLGIIRKSRARKMNMNTHTQI